LAPLKTFSMPPDGADQPGANHQRGRSTAIASWVKLVAVPGPVPGPCAAKAALAVASAARLDVAQAERVIRVALRKVAMMISCDIRRRKNFRRYAVELAPVSNPVREQMISQKGTAAWPRRSCL
jgi:hypothetical protein